MVKISLGRFDVTIECENGTAPVSSLPVGGPGSQRVTLRNRTTLPYDVRTTCEFPDPKPPRALSYPAASSKEVINTAAVSGSGSATALQPLDVHGPAAIGQRLQITIVEYRLTTHGVPPSVGGLWKPLSAGALPSTDTIDVA
jgi:hypothetical protein